MRFSVILSLFLVGSLALADDLREVKAERAELLAIDDIRRRSAEIVEARNKLDEAAKQLSADAQAITSETRIHHGLAPGDLLSFEKIDQGILLVRVAPVAPVQSAAVAAPSSPSR